MGLLAAGGQLLVMALLLGGCALYTRHHVSSLQRADFTDLEYFEDSKAGNGTRYRVLEGAADTGHASFTVEVLSRAGVPGFLPELSGSSPEHRHTQGQAEEVVVLSGTLGYRLGRDGRAGTKAAGEHVVFPAGVQHVIYNADNTTDLLYTLTHTPAGPMGESFFENLAGLGWDYGSIDRIHPMQVLVLFDAAGTQLMDVSGMLAPLVDRVLLPVAHLMGFKAHYPSHNSRHSTSTRQQQQHRNEAWAATDSEADSSRSSKHEEL